MLQQGTGRLGALIRDGLAAAQAVAGEQRLPGGDPVILSCRGNLVVHLAPAPVVAKVATLTAWTRRSPFDWLAREVSVADYAARRGGPVVPPTRLADPGPHRSGGFAVSLWTFRPPADPPGARPRPADVGAALAALHRALDGYPASQLPWLSPALDQVTEGLAALEAGYALDPARVAALRTRHAEIRAGLDRLGGSPVVLHGDAHGGNLLPGPDGWRWIDLEETCQGPLAWDLATLAAAYGTATEESQAALDGYAAASGQPVPGPGVLAQFARARELEAAVWALGMAHQNPARYRELAGSWLARILR
ncbi:MAG TPA: phosphotransferase [Streptosporangiaceae bacterium]|nr:phosphotransferase [Streptosporangiaceae bacterium]